jgi:hypothetical protein
VKTNNVTYIYRYSNGSLPLNPDKVVAAIPAFAGDDLNMTDEIRSGKEKNCSSLLMIARVPIYSNTHYPHRC